MPLPAPGSLRPCGSWWLPRAPDRPAPCISTPSIGEGADDDFVGLQVYSCARIGPAGPVAPAPELRTLADMEFRPGALGVAVRRAASLLPGTPLLVTENGIATADDTRRIAYTSKALRHLFDI